MLCALATLQPLTFPRVHGEPLLFVFTFFEQSCTCAGCWKTHIISKPPVQFRDGCKQKKDPFFNHGSFQTCCAPCEEGYLKTGKLPPLAHHQLQCTLSAWPAMTRAKGLKSAHRALQANLTTESHENQTGEFSELQHPPFRCQAQDPGEHAAYGGT